MSDDRSEQPEEEDKKNDADVADDYDYNEADDYAYDEMHDYGFFGAGAACHAGAGTRRVFMSVLNMTSNFAGIPLAFASIILLGGSGVLVLLGKQLGFAPLAEYNMYSFSGLLLIYVYFQVPVATILLIPSFDALHKEWR